MGFFKWLARGKKIWASITTVAHVIAELDEKIDTEDGLSLQEALTALRIIRKALKDLGLVTDQY